jgi:hypothetical protein
VLVSLWLLSKVVQCLTVVMQLGHETSLAQRQTETAARSGRRPNISFTLLELSTDIHRLGKSKPDLRVSWVLRRF